MNKSQLLLTIIITTLTIACGGGGGGSTKSAPVATAPPSSGSSNTNTSMELTDSLWKFDSGAAVRSTAAISDSSVFFANNNGDVYALNKDNGEQIWHRELEHKISGGLQYSQNNVIAFNSEGTLFALNAEDGETKWSINTSGESLVDQWDYHTNTPVIVDETIYLASRSGMFFHSILMMERNVGLMI